MAKEMAFVTRLAKLCVKKHDVVAITRSLSHQLESGRNHNHDQYFAMCNSTYHSKAEGQ